MGEQAMNDMKWWRVLSALYAVSLTKDDVEDWEYFLKKHGAKNDELCAIIEQASFRSFMPRGYKVTAADLIIWIDLSRRGWPSALSRPIQAVKP
jgi:hypothetical protein